MGFQLNTILKWVIVCDWRPWSCPWSCYPNSNMCR